nr:hypothetical protein [Tanacetum cinerariifolium]
MDDRGGGGSFVAVRRISHGLDRTNNTYHTSSAEVTASSAAWLGRGLSCVCVQGREGESRPSFDLTPAQEHCLQRLQNRLEIAYDSSIPRHQKFPVKPQSFVGATFLKLLSENESAFDLLYCITFKLMDQQWLDMHASYMDFNMLDLEAVKPQSFVGATFLKLLSENESAFDLLYCVTFKLMDQQWLDMHASYMDFNAVMKSTRRQLERELLQDDITRLEELPSYNLLSR